MGKLNTNLTGRQLLEYLIDKYPNTPAKEITEYTGLSWQQVRGFVDRARLMGHKIAHRPHNMDMSVNKQTPEYVQYLMDNYSTAARLEICEACGGIAWSTVQDRVRRLRRQGYQIPARERFYREKQSPEKILDEYPEWRLPTMPKKHLVEAILLYRQRYATNEE